MSSAPASHAETLRLEELLKYHILDSGSEECFDQISRLAAKLFSVEIAVISFADVDRQWIKSQVGVDIKSVPRNLAICAHTLLCDDHLLIPDLALDNRTSDHPFLLENGIHFYAGVPIVSKRGFRLGCICIMDSRSRNLSDAEISLLHELSAQVSSLLELRRQGEKLAKAYEQLESSLDKSSICTWKWWIEENRVDYSSGWRKLLGETVHSEDLSEWEKRVHPDDLDRVRNDLTAYLENKTSNYESVHRLKRGDGTWAWVLSKGWVEKISSSGAALLIAGTAIDITNQKVIEQELLENQQKTNAIFEGSHDAIVLTGEDGRFYDCNSKTLEMFGFSSKDDFLLIRPSDISPEYQPDGQSSFVKASEAISRAFEVGAQRFDWIHRKQNGEEFPAEILLSPFQYHEKRLLHATMRDISARKKLENLNLNLQKLALIGAWELDLISQEAKCTSQISEIYGIESEGEGIISMSDGIEYYAPHERSRITKCIQDCGEFGTSFDEVFEFNDAKNNRKWVRVIGEPELNGSGKIFRVKGTLQDVTEMKEMQIVTQKQNDELTRLDMAINQNMCVIKMDSQGKITYANDNYCSKMQLKREELIGRLFSIFGNDNDKNKNAIWNEIRRGVTWKGHLKNRKKDGTIVWGDATIVPVFELGHLQEVICFAIDVTSEKRTMSLLSAISSLRNKYIECSEANQTFYEHALKLLLDLSDSRLGVLGEKIKDTTGSDSIKIHAATHVSWISDIQVFYPQIIKSSGPFFLNRLKHKNDGTFHPSYTALLGIPIFHSEKLLGLAFLADDHSSYNHEDIQYLTPFLDVLGEMIHSSKLKEELQVQTRLSFHNSKLAMIGELAAGVGHEINNPLVIIQGFRKIISAELSKLGVKEEILNYCNNIDLATNRISNIVKGLRAFSRTDTEDQTVFDLKELVEESCSMLQQIYQKSEIVLSTQDDGSPSARMFGNRGRIQQVLMNLISNARDASEGKRSRKISVTLTHSKDVLKVSVEDNGGGVPDEIREKIFEPFFTTKEVNKGTGIGLSLSYNIIHEHHGTLGFQNTADGARFTFSVPAWSDKKEVSVVSAANISKITGKILVVEDEENIRQIIVFFLKRCGASVVACSNGEEALLEWEKGGYDLVISDTQMPEMNGLELLKAIRSKTSYAQPKFIMMSGRKMTEDDELYTTLKCDGFLPKPFYPEQLCEYVLQVLNSGKAA